MKTLIRLAKSNGKKSIIPVLQQICVDDTGAHSTDMDIWLSVPSESIKKGMYYADSFNLLIDPIKTSIPTGDFPGDYDMGTRTGTVKLNAEQMQAFEWVLKAASTEITRYYLNSIYFDKTQIVATDGHRMHIIELDIQRSEDFKGGLIMPSKAVLYLIYLHKEYKENVVIHIHEKGFVCEIGSASLKSKHVDGTYPDYRKVFPKIKDCGKTLFDPQEIIDLKPHLDVLEKNNLVGKSIIFEGGKIKVSESVNDNNYEWETQTKIPYKCGFNRKYLGDLCAGVLHYSNEEGRAIFITQRRGIKKTALLMPMRV